MRKRHGFGTHSAHLRDLTPAKLIESRDTAVVSVHGEIPAAAMAGVRFDVVVEALDRTQTVSLEGGHLLGCELRIYRPATSGAVLEGGVLARAFGPVFVRPFGQSAEAAETANLRRGYVIGGGASLEDRRVQLALAEPGYPMARRIENLIDERFGWSPKVADAVSPGRLDLTVPAGYRGRESRFLHVLLHLYLPREAGFLEKRARELADEILSPLAPYEDISLAWEGIGKPAVPLVQPLYAHRERHVSYYAARAGVRLGDDLAVGALKKHAQDPGSAYRLLAVRELGDAKNIPAATRALRALADETSTDVRLGAYEALLEHPAGGIRSTDLGRGSFMLDVVPSKGRYLIFAKRTVSRRVAVFGEHLQCEPPVFYGHRDGSITIHARVKDKHLTLIRKTPFAGRISEPIQTSFKVIELIRMLGDDPVTDDAGNVRGLGLNYSHVVDALFALCRDGAISAEFRLEEPGLTGIVPTTAQRTGRPESDL